MPEPPRRRSFEANSLRVPSSEPGAEKYQTEIFAGFRNSADSKDSVTQQAVSRSLKANDVGLGSLGRRISVSMSLGPRKERKSGRTDKERKSMKMETPGLIGKRNEHYDDGISSAGSKPTSRQPSPGPSKNPKRPTNISKSRKQDALEAAYLRRLLEDTTPSLSNPFAMLRMTSSNGSSPTWSKMSSTQGVEDCLKKFTAVEALDGDNMFGCRNVGFLGCVYSSLTGASSAGRLQMGKLREKRLHILKKTVTSRHMVKYIITIKSCNHQGQGLWNLGSLLQSHISPLSSAKITAHQVYQLLLCRQHWISAWDYRHQLLYHLLP